MLTADELAQLEVQYPGCVHCVPPTGSPSEEPAWEVVVRPPTRPEFQRYRTRLRDQRWQGSAVEELITACVVVPDRNGFQALLDGGNGRPPRAGLCEGIASIPAVAEMMGLAADVAGKR